MVKDFLPRTSMENRLCFLHYLFHGGSSCCAILVPSLSIFMSCYAV
jgi:hypothetical protein